MFHRKRKAGWSTKRDGLRSSAQRPRPNRRSAACRSTMEINTLNRFPRMIGSSLSTLRQEGILKQEVWSSRLQWLGVKAKIEIPLSGTGFNVRQTTLRIENLPESWPMDTESAWRERYCKEDFTFQDIVAHLQEDSFTDDIFEGYENTKAFRWVAVFNEFWP